MCSDRARTVKTAPGPAAVPMPHNGVERLFDHLTRTIVRLQPGRRTNVPWSSIARPGQEIRPRSNICTNGRAILCQTLVRREITMSEHQLTDRQRSILEFISAQMRERGFPPSVREIGAAVGLTSPSTVHSHLATLQKKGYLKRDPSKPRAIEVCWDSTSDSPGVERRPVRHVPLVGQVAAGTDVLAAEHIEETFPVPADLAGDGDLFMLTVVGDSMINAGILDGDFVVAKVQNTAKGGDIVVAGIPGEEATVKTYSIDKRRGDVVLLPANPALEPMRFKPNEITIFGRVVTVMRRL